MRDRQLGRPRAGRSRVARWAISAVTVLALSSLAACGGSSDDADAAKKAPASDATMPVELPPSADLTPPGTTLHMGEVATVFWAPTEALNATLNLAVTAARHVTPDELKGFNLDSAYTKTAAFYFVNVTVTNLGGGDVGGLDVPVQGVGTDRILFPAVVFESPFKPCPSTPLPKVFAPGATYEGCLVFAVQNQGDLLATTFDPVESIEPIDWPGASVTPVTPVAP